MENNYNETDAAIFVHKHISPQMQQKYTIEQIEYLLEIIGEYYDSADCDEDENGVGVNIVKMTSYINNNIGKTICSPVKYRETGMILNADNAYMESIGILEEDDCADDMTMEEISNSVYALLSQDIKSRYDIDDIFTVLCMEFDYIINNIGIEKINKNKVYKYIQQNAADNGIEISIADIQEILHAELSFVNDYGVENGMDT